MTGPDGVPSRSAFERRLRARRTDADAFVAALYRARGWTVEDAGDGFVAARQGVRRRVVVRRPSRVGGDHAPVPPAADVVVATGDPSGSLRRATDAAGATLVGPAALHRRLRYGISREAAADLCRAHLGRSLTAAGAALSPGRAGRDGGWRRAATVAVLLAVSLAAATLALAAFPPTTAPSADDAGTGGAGPATSTDGVTATQTSTAAAGSSLATGIAAEGATRVEVGPADWPAARGGPARAGAANGSGPGIPLVARVHDTGAGGVSAPALAGGWLYLGNARGRVVALRTRTMTRAWNRTLTGPLTAAPAVGRDTVYAPSLDGVLYAFDAGTGVTRWRTSLGAASFLTAPAVRGGTVYVGSGSGVHAVWPNGTVRWHAATGDGVVTGPAVANGTVYAVDRGRRVHALDAATGEQRWVVALSTQVAGTPVARADGLVLCDVGGRCGVRGRASGDLLWARNLTDAIPTSPALRGDGLYVGSQDGAVYALNATDGRRRWNATVGDGAVTAPAVSRRAVYVGSRGGAVYALNVTDGGRSWVVGTADPVTSPPAVARGAVFVTSTDGLVYVVRALPAEGAAAPTRGA
ncbi:MAG: PQQ-binding-like beta-propeller repeat protein [Halobacteriaceae archaeon]